MKLLVHYALVAPFVLALSLGCRLMEEQPHGKSPLASAQASPDSVTLEVFFARAKSKDAVTGDRFWSQIDEQVFPADLRRSFEENGFRAGVVGSPLPEQLTTLLKISERAMAESKASALGLDSEQSVTKRLLQLRPGHPGEIVASHIYEELPLLDSDGGEVRGRRYNQAQGMFSLRAAPHAGGGVEIELLPELQYGAPRLRRVISEGMIRMEPGRDKRSFKQLALNATLAPGEMLVLTCRADRPGSVGQKFFTEPASDELVQKLIVIRVAQDGPDPLFAAGAQASKNSPAEE